MIPLLMHQFGGINHENYGSLKGWQVDALLRFLKRIGESQTDDDDDQDDDVITKVRDD